MKFEEKNVDPENEFVEIAANDTFEVLTGIKTLDEVYDANHKFVALFFDPFSETDGKAIIDKLVQYYELVEQYERCGKLLELKSEITDGTEWLNNLLWSDEDERRTTRESREPVD